MRIIVTLLKWIIGILIGSIVVIAASVIIDRSVGVNRLDGITNTVIPNGSNPAIRAYVARPNGTGPFPVVIAVPPPKQNPIIATFWSSASGWF